MAMRMAMVALLVGGALVLGACGSKDDGGAIVPSNNTPTTAAPGGSPSTTPYP